MPAWTREESIANGYTKFCERDGCPAKGVPQRKDRTTCHACGNSFDGEDRRPSLLKLPEKPANSSSTSASGLYPKPPLGQKPRKTRIGRLSTIEFGNRLRYWRTLERVSLDVLSTRLNLEESEIENIENGKTSTDDYVRECIATALSLTLESFESPDYK